MKKLTYLFAAAALLAACNGGKTGYTVTGTVEGAADGDTVYLATIEGRQLINQDTAVISNGSFTFKGEQDSVSDVYLCYQNDESKLIMNFFLENGTIRIKLTDHNGDSAVGTETNDIYQPIRSKLDEVEKQMGNIYESLSTDTTLTDIERAAKMNEAETLEEKYYEIAKEGIKQNITNYVGIYLLKHNYYAMTVDELAPLMPQIPEAFNDEYILKIKSSVEKMQATAVGQKFTDFEMLTPEGNPIKLSDYAGKGKVVLVDFWASWCGPCRREMPNIVEAYAKYKDKGLEIVGVSLDQDNEAWVNAIEKLNITWPQMSDLKFWGNEGAQLYAVNSIPHTVLIDGKGTIIARGLHGEGLQEKLAEVIK